jgi:cystathionine beta-lyase
MNFDDLDIHELRQRKGEKWQSFGDEALAAWVADMDFPPAEPIRRQLSHMIEVSDLGYPINPKSDGLPTLFSERMARLFDWRVDPQRVDVLTDVVQGLFVGLEVFTKPGQGVLIQTPIYPPFLHATHQTKRRQVLNTLVEGSERYEIDFDALRASIDSETRLFLLCNPHNPTGRVLEREELELIAEIVVEHDLVVLSDEIHAELVYSGANHIPIATLGPEIEARTITFMSASKSFNIAGLRCAVAAYGSAEIKRQFNSLPRHLRGGLGTLGLAATRVAWEECDDWLAALLQYLQANRDFACDFVAKRLSGVRAFVPEATYMVWLDCRALELEAAPQQHFLENARVALSDGAAFGEPGEGFVRLNFATSRKILTEVLERMEKSL